MLDGGVDDEDHLNTTLRNVLQDRAARDTIRRVHLVADDSELSDSIISSLTANRGGLRSNSMESFILWNRGDTSVDVSDFFAHYLFPKLQRLDLFNCAISSWDHLTFRTSVLTTLELNFDEDFDHDSPTPTTSQLLSILTSNPGLRKVQLSMCAIPEDGVEESSTPVQLHHLKELRLEGDLRHVFKLLHRLDFPRNMDKLLLTLHNCDVTDVSQIVGPYLRDHLRRRDRPQNGLGLWISSGTGYGVDHISLEAGSADGINFSAPEWERTDTFIEVAMPLEGAPHKRVIERAALDLITYVPLDEVVYLRAYDIPAAMEDTNTRFPNLRVLSFSNMSLTTAFQNPNLIADGKVFPSLKHISLKSVDVGQGDWSPLTAFLACRVSSGNRLDTLEIADFSRMCSKVMKAIRSMVGELKVGSPGTACLCRTCS